MTALITEYPPLRMKNVFPDSDDSFSFAEESEDATEELLPDYDAYLRWREHMKFELGLPPELETPIDGYYYWKHLQVETEEDEFPPEFQADLDYVHWRLNQESYETQEDTPENSEEDSEEDSEDTILANSNLWIRIDRPEEKTKNSE